MHLLSWEFLGGHEDNFRIRLKRDANVSNYAILSHRWGNPEDEVSFEDMLADRQKHNKGYMKLVKCCKQARRDGLHYVWIDTCCIDKASSAELSEAITSMFTYYERSNVCYVFLDDVFIIDSSAKEELPASSLSQSAWFTRGWTLQELIAPPHVKFFDGSWSFLGFKTDELLSEIIESVTKIDKIVLNDPATTKLISISKKMSWAARRKTTRIEDKAYSLMGIFGVYMTPMYGEGNHAFIRLQEAIMRTSNDHTIFAWTSPPTAPLNHGFEHVSTMLALSPDQFEHSSNFKSLSYSQHSKALNPGGYKLDYAIKNTGLAIRLPLLAIEEVEGLYAAFLACTEGEDRIPSAILLRTTAKTPPGHFWRTNSSIGPIERNERRWFPISGREAIEANDIYVLPRFTSVSGDNIEPSWSRVDIAKTQHETAGNISSGTKKNSFVLNTEVLSDLNHVPDPSFHKLAFLHQAHQMIYTNQAHQLVNTTKTGPLFPKLMPFLQNSDFFGRATVLQTLRDAFFSSDKNPWNHDRRTSIYTISGMAGIGKTEVAVEFSYDCVKNHLFDTVIWIHAESTSAIIDTFQRIASVLKLDELGSPADPVRKVLQWLSNFHQHTNVLNGSRASLAPWLLVFDNAVDSNSRLCSFWPPDGPGCVLVTRRDPDSQFQSGRRNIILEPFTIQESSELLSNLTRKDWDFTAVSERLDGHPLAIVQSASFLVQSQLSLEEFLLIFDKSETAFLGSRWAPPESNYRGDLFEVWSLALSELSTSSREVLQVFSFLNPDFIQDSMLKQSRTVASEQLPWKSLNTSDNRSDLLSAALISRSPVRRGVRVHRLVQDVVRIKMDPDEFQKALSNAEALVSSAWIDAISRDLSKPSNRQVLDNLLPHVTRLKDFAAEMIDSKDGFCTKTDFARLLSDVEEQGFLH